MDTRCMRLQIALGQVIRARRVALGLPQSALAKRAGTHRPLVARAEGGTHELMLRTLLRYAEALGCSVTDLVAAAEQLCALEASQRVPRTHHDPRQADLFPLLQEA